MNRNSKSIMENKYFVKQILINFPEIILEHIRSLFAGNKSNNIKGIIMDENAKSYFIVIGSMIMFYFTWDSIPYLLNILSSISSYLNMDTVSQKGMRMQYMVIYFVTGLPYAFVAHRVLSSLGKKTEESKIEDEMNVENKPGGNLKQVKTTTLKFLILTIQLVLFSSLWFSVTDDFINNQHELDKYSYTIFGALYVAFMLSAWHILRFMEFRHKY